MATIALKKSTPFISAYSWTWPGHPGLLLAIWNSVLSLVDIWLVKSKSSPAADWNPLKNATICSFSSLYKNINGLSKNLINIFCTRLSFLHDINWKIGMFYIYFCPPDFIRLRRLLSGYFKSSWLHTYSLINPIWSYLEILNPSSISLYQITLEPMFQTIKSCLTVHLMLYLTTLWWILSKYRKLSVMVLFLISYVRPLSSRVNDLFRKPISEWVGL